MVELNLPQTLDRASLLARLSARADAADPFDLAVIGGGATGLGVALDAAVRGLSVVLLESHDFAAGTSSRATKLAHGGVRYLAQGDIGLVREALAERAAMLANAPHLAQRLPFVMPGYRWWERAYYGLGLKAYDALAGRQGLGGTEWLSARRVQELLPGVQPRGLWGGVRYWDGQFDDARLAVALARSAAARGALLLNHMPVVALQRRGGRIVGLVARDAETGAEHAVAARCVVNATGVWVDDVRRLDGDRDEALGAGAPSPSSTSVGAAAPAAPAVAAMPSPTAPGAPAAPAPQTRVGATAAAASASDAAASASHRVRTPGGGPEPSRAGRHFDPLVSPSQGVHLVVDRAFLPGGHALLIPRTDDGRVLFAVPWLGKTVLGTTDTPRADLAREPEPFAEEVRFILGEAGRVLARAPQRADVRSVWVGLRPLVKPVQPGAAGAAGHGPWSARLPQAGGPGGTAPSTGSISREHTVQVAPSGLITVTGGKWTTYRSMAEDVLAQAMARGLLPQRPAGGTRRLPLLGAAAGRPLSEPPGEHLYGSEAAALRALPGADRWLWRDPESGRGGLSEAMVRFAARFEMARTVEDVLARRSRLLFLDAAEAARRAEAVGRILGDELGAAIDPAPLQALAAQYQRLP
jgi:glycerol-3-phosphate dehydrogenase